MNDQERVYLDWAAATPLLPEAKAALLPWLESDWGNPSAIHEEGKRAHEAVEAAREQIAKAVQVRPEFVTFTGGGTEGNNLGIFGTIERLRAAGRAYSEMEVVSTKIEHPSITRAMERLRALGVSVRYVEVKESGVIDLADLRTQLNEKTVLVTYAYANSEIGTVQPTRAIGKVVKAAEEQYGTEILTLVDAAQAPLWLTCQFDAVGADFLVLDASKCCGPKGVGALIRSRRAELAPVVYGGGQEAGRRPGTENVAGIAGAAVAIAWAQADWRERVEKIAAVRDQALEHVRAEISEVVVNGADGGDRIANNINISIPGLDTEYAAVVLDAHGFAVSTKSACSGAGGGASTVVLETTGDPARASSTLRVTLGPDTIFSQLQSLTAVLKQHVAQMKQY